MRRKKAPKNVVELDTSAEWSRRSKDLVDPVRGKKEKEERSPVAPALGPLSPDAGRASSGCRPIVWRSTTTQVAGINPFLTAAPLPSAGIPIGVDLYSGATVPWHPVEWLQRKLISNPNTLATGEPGAGKSTWLKMQIIRMAALGVSSVVSYDIKGEYNVLADWLECPATTLGGGSSVRLNPLDGGPLATQMPANDELRQERILDIHRRRLRLLLGIIEQRLERRVTPLEETAISLALDRVSNFAHTGDLRSPLLGEVLAELWSLVESPPIELHIADSMQLADEIRPAALALRNLLTDTLSGLFDGATTHPIDFGKALQSVDISRLDSRGEDAVAIAISCLSTWTLAAIEDPNRALDAPARHVITDELWRLLRYPAQVRKLDADLRLSRSQGYMRTLVTHRLSDFEAAALPELATDIASSCAVRVLFAQDVISAPKIANVLALSKVETEMVSSWGAGERGRFLARIGPDRAYVCQTIPTAQERILTHTNERMRV